MLTFTLDIYNLNKCYFWRGNKFEVYLELNSQSIKQKLTDTVGSVQTNWGVGGGICPKQKIACHALGKN